MPFQNLSSPPTAERREWSDTRHGVTRKDDYAWLRAENWKEVFKDPSTLDQAIRDYLEAENDFVEKAMVGTKGLRERLVSEMRGRIKEDDSSVPMKRGPYAYGSEFVTGGQHPRSFREPRDGGERTVLLDADAEAKARKDGADGYFRPTGLGVSPDHALGVWGYDDQGSEYFTLAVRDLDTLEDRDEHLTNTGGGGVWDAESGGFFYTLLDENHRPSKVLYHALGTNQDDDRLIREEPDAGMFMGVGGSIDDSIIMIDVHDHETSEIRIVPADDPAAEPILIAARETGHEYDVEAAEGTLFIRTNDGGQSPDFRIVTASVDAPERENWEELVPHVPGRLILGVSAYKRHLVRLERENAVPRIVIRARDTGEEHAIAFDEEAYSLGLIGAAEYDTDTIRFSYSSMTTPSRQYEYDMATRERQLIKEQEVPSGHDPADYETRRIMVTSHDGEEVPVSLLYRRGTKLDGSNPCLLYGYGSYGIAIPAGFNTNCLSLVDRGFVYAIAHIRGGKDKGQAWYDRGKREHKENTFRDFVACARALVSEGYTSADRLVAQGGSAGGMLMGAVVNMAPDAFGGIVAEVPFVDVLSTMLDDTLPLTPPEWPEWGNPIESEADYRRIAAYSPYDNVEAKAYPPILAVGGLTDPRVTYWEPAKWVAKLRAHQTGDAPIFLKTNMGAGHGGAAGRFDRLEEIAFNYAFALTCVGLAEEEVAEAA